MKLSKITQEAKKILQDAWKTWWELNKILIPFLLLTKALQMLGVINWISSLFSPLMFLFGLPGEMGIVFTTSIFLNPFASLLVFASLSPTIILTTAQVTVLGSMMLISHALPVEIGITRKAGLHTGFQLILRMGGAAILGVLLNLFYQLSGWLQTPNQFLWTAPAQNTGLLEWGLNQLQNVLMVFFIILGLLILLRLLDTLGITKIINFLLQPFLKWLGMSEKAIPITIIGITLGIAVGGGLVIQEARSGKMDENDVFFSLVFMCLFHSLIEDTAYLMLMGAHLSGLVIARLIFSMLVSFLFFKLRRFIPETFFRKYLYSGAQSESV